MNFHFECELCGWHVPLIIWVHSIVKTMSAFVSGSVNFYIVIMCICIAYHHNISSADLHSSKHSHNDSHDMKEIGKDGCPLISQEVKHLPLQNSNLWTKKNVYIKINSQHSKRLHFLWTNTTANVKKQRQFRARLGKIGQRVMWGTYVLITSKFLFQHFIAVTVCWSVVPDSPSSPYNY